MTQDETAYSICGLNLEIAGVPGTVLKASMTGNLRIIYSRYMLLRETPWLTFRNVGAIKAMVYCITEPYWVGDGCISIIFLFVREYVLVIHKILD